MPLVNSITTDLLTVQNLFEGELFNGNNGSLFVSEKQRVGVGETSPFSKLHIKINKFPNNNNPDKFVASDNRTWNAITIQNESSTTNTATGLLFTPNDTNASNIGSSILAVRTGATGSDLVFVSDPENSAPAEHLRLKDSGAVALGIGANEPSADLHVGGTAFFEDITIQSTLNVSSLGGVEGTFASTNINVMGETEVINILSTDLSLTLTVQQLGTRSSTDIWNFVCR